MNRAFSGWVGVAALSMWLIGASDVAAQKKNEPTNASIQEYNLLNSVKDVRGKVASVSATSYALTITVDTSHTEVAQAAKPTGNTNPSIKPIVSGQRTEARDAAKVQKDAAKLQQDIVRMQLEEIQLAQAKNQKDAASKLARLQKEIVKVQQDYARLQQDLARLQMQEMRNAVQDQRYFQQALANYAKSQPTTYIVNSSLNFDLIIDEKAVLRKMFVPADTTDKEKQELKGKNTSLPGYTATIEDIAVGQEVHIYLTAGKPSAKDKQDARPTINKIIILSDKAANLKNKPKN